ncbi:helix-turn-helix domain-containing protein [Blastococcus sp. CCUG 61487]|uniref:helix-turn-helix transcriptional regulator n=1 Tax=Blastococcus sp. CCUG 61487 TaxID=1840703 RepID=UPI00201DBD39|nr:helix-turn-helix domain-containing protein [Blastococcus sp. CCUG 61487]
MAPSVVKAPPPTTPGASHARPHRRSRAELLTITEAADVLRAPVATLRYWRHLGTGPNSFRLGRRVLYRRADLRSWIDAQAAQSWHR